MKKNLLKKISVATVALILSLSMVACGGSKTTALSVDDYKAKVTEIYQTIETETQKYDSSMSSIDPNDLEAVLSATKDSATKMKPYYEQLAALEAPKEFADEQAKIKDGAEASVELLDISTEMTELQGDPDAATKAQDKVAELTAKMTELAPKTQDFQTALDTIMAE